MRVFVVVSILLLFPVPGVYAASAGRAGLSFSQDIKPIFDDSRYFRLVRSRTAAPDPVIPLATVKPNSEPDGAFFYRLVALTNTIVHKTHIVYELSDARMARYHELFLGDDWALASLPGYGYEHVSNPFVTFDRWGVRRSHPEFRAAFHSIRHYVESVEPHQAGYYDLNRYEGW